MSLLFRGSILYLDGEKVVDNNGCHGETEKPSHEKFLPAGLHNLVVDMCEMGGHEIFKMRYQGPDTGNSKITVPKFALKHAQARLPFVKLNRCRYLWKGLCH